MSHRYYSVLQAIQEAQALFAGSDIFYGHGTDNPVDEAYALVLDALHLSHTLSDEVLHDLPVEHPERLYALMQQRVVQRTPVPYLTHTAWFCGLAFYVDERVLIPRSPLAELIEVGFAPWCEPDQVRQVLDLCTGSGCLAITCAYAFPQAQIDAVDISVAALAVAHINITQHQCTDRVQVCAGDLWEAVPRHGYDIIVSNPPYVGEEEMQALPKEYHAEPVLALASGTVGLDMVDRILRTARQYLKPNGILVVEVGNTAQLLEAHYPRLPFIWLTFERGGDGVFLLHAADLSQLD